MADGTLSINRNCERCGTDFWCQHFSMDGEQCGCHSCGQALTVPAPIPYYPNPLEVLAGALAFALVELIIGKPSPLPRQGKYGKRKKKRKKEASGRRLSKKTPLSDRPRI